MLGSEEEKTELARRAEAFSEQDLIRYFDLLLRLESDIKWTSQPRFHLEIGLVKLAKAAHIRDIEDVLRDLKQGPAGPSSSLQRACGPSTASAPASASPGGKPTSCGIRTAASGRHRSRLQRRSLRSRQRAGFTRCGRDCRSSPEHADDSALNSAREEPLVQRFLEVFRGDIAQVKPSKGETQ